MTGAAHYAAMHLLLLKKKSLQHPGATKRDYCDHMLAAVRSFRFLPLFFVDEGNQMKEMRRNLKGSSM